MTTIEGSQLQALLETIPCLKEELAKPIYSTGVYCKGGAARIALSVHLGLYNEDTLRDSDFAYIGAKESQPAGVADLDFEGEDFAEYFNSRDTAINEVLVRPGCLIFTDRAAKAMQTATIDTEEAMSSRLLSRVTLFAARYNYDFSHEVTLDGDVYDFDILVTMLKAFELKIERVYFTSLQQLGLYTDCNSLGSLLVKLLTSVYGFSLLGRESLIAHSLIGCNIDGLTEDYPQLTQLVASFDYQALAIRYYSNQFLNL